MKRAINYALPLAAMFLSLGWMHAAHAQQAKKSAQPKVADSTQHHADIAKRQANKEVVFSFYKAVARADFETARKYIGDYYIEHDPERQDGLPGLQKALDYNRRSRITMSIIHELVVADGDYVTLYSHLARVRSPPAGAAPPGGGSSGGGPRPPNYTPVTDIFRLSEGKIVEHWNAVLQPQ